MQPYITEIDWIFARFNNRSTTKFIFNSVMTSICVSHLFLVCVNQLRRLKTEHYPQVMSKDSQEICLVFFFKFPNQEICDYWVDTRNSDDITHKQTNQPTILSYSCSKFFFLSCLCTCTNEIEWFIHLQIKFINNFDFYCYDAKLSHTQSIVLWQISLSIPSDVWPCINLFSLRCASAEEFNSWYF